MVTKISSYFAQKWTFVIKNFRFEKYYSITDIKTYGIFMTNTSEDENLKPIMEKKIFLNCLSKISNKARPNW
jgi:hypothetical protein